MEQLNFDEVKASNASHFAVMPDGFIYKCKTNYFQEPAVGLFRRQSIGFVQGGWEFLVARGNVKELEKTEAYINKNFSVIADLIPRIEFPKEAKYGNTIIPNLKDFLVSGIDIDLFCTYLDKDDEFDQVPVEITKDLYDYYVYDEKIEREKIEYVDCVLVRVDYYLPKNNSHKLDLGYAFTSKNGKYYCLGKMYEHTAKYYGNGSKLKEAVKEFNKNTNYSLAKSIEITKDRELESIKKKCEKLRLSEESAWKNTIDLAFELGTAKVKNRELEKENTELRKYQHDSISRELAYAETIRKLNAEIKEHEYISKNKTEQIEQLKIWLTESNSRELELDKELKTLKELQFANSYDRMAKSKQEKYMRNRIDSEVSKFVTQNIYKTLDIEE